MTQQPQAVETSRELASQAIELAGEKVSGLREGLKNASTDAQRQLGRYVKQTRRYVSKRPVTSALIVAAVGAAVTALAVAVLRNARQHP